MCKDVRSASETMKKQIIYRMESFLTSRKDNASTILLAFPVPIPDKESLYY